jgi:hypothetical protein
MKKNLTIIALVLLIIIAAKPKGEVVGASSKTLFERVFQEENPYGMVYVKAGVVHRLENPGLIDLVMIEVQVGEYVGEDDIMRLEDDFKRDEI